MSWFLLTIIVVPIGIGLGFGLVRGRMEATRKAPREWWSGNGGRGIKDHFPQNLFWVDRPMSMSGYAFLVFLAAVTIAWVVGIVFLIAWLL